MAAQAALIGEWVRSAAPVCAAVYPTRLRLGADGQLRGEAAQPGEFTLWDVGTWTPDGDDILALTTANDALVRYRYTLAGNTLEFTDAAGCRFAYRRT